MQVEFTKIMKQQSMLGYLLRLLLFTGHLLLAQGANWALLVAGTKGWFNYRYQADVCRAYQILQANGFPKEHVITMMYDDIAYNPRNPFPGKIFNTLEAVDVYDGVIVDYRGTEVTGEMFLRVLAGDEDLALAGRKVISGNPEDNIFIFIATMGAPNIISFPNDVIYGQQFVDMLEKQYKLGRFKNVLIYAESSFAGSLFNESLAPPTPASVYAVTSTSHTESSFATLCDNPFVDTCLTNEFTQRWMDGASHCNYTKYTVGDQFFDLKAQNMNSTLSDYGAWNIRQQLLISFLGDEQNGTVIGKGQTARFDNFENPPRKMVEKLFNDIVEIVTRRVPVVHKTAASVSVSENCQTIISDTFQQKCLTIEQAPQIAHEMHKLRKLCSMGHEVTGMIQVIKNVCA